MTWVYYLSPPELRELYLTVLMIEVTFICGKVSCNVMCGAVAEWTYNTVKWVKSVKKGWLKPENTENMPPACWGKGKAKVPHLYHVAEVSPHASTNPAQFQHNYYPLPGVPALSSSVFQTFPLQQTCVHFSEWTNSSFRPALGGFQMPLSSCTFWLGPLFGLL